jgi:hypothetical protein
MPLAPPQLHPPTFLDGPMILTGTAMIRRSTATYILCHGALALTMQLTPSNLVYLLLAASCSSGILELAAALIQE